ncbi:16S rRNA (guanine(527)-N(7))-methyltransferase RsmG [Aureibacter tunicatorum]|uniref:Ribosomal RNA small subunit methyltransferase G n=1 Tax=Aureibacter tunicatorum TaxID=866807 RepID=A0AAE3XJ47_9BACT|nr:16S rRNA (guanine(527)-N(7))-methyltransferase RsmG [Aureibacter tunicatorum]MDR6237089.1 16S rRNA (guanine527-N7)-methyltransferase [Aureibacter tunicatorum]BDD06081.1 ribosomal RNA small subunit methyltransferase G [Aureibacter tunicatorum]
MNGVDLIIKYFPDLTDLQKQRFEELGRLYPEWNDKINVISRKDIDQLYTRHILHSLAIAKVINFKPMTTCLDVGTGGGFPGIPLAIMFPDSDFHMIDSIGKKISVVNGIIEALDLQNAEGEQIRAEQIHDHYDFVISRAVTRLKPFYQWIKNNISRNSFNDLDNGILYLKGGDLREEMKEAKKKYTLYDINDFYDEEFFDTKKVVHVPIVN